MSHFREAYQALNERQRQAVDAIDGPVLVIAGPGTGKTQLLSVRVANILRLSDVNPENILCLTYTESGQRAMQERLLAIIGEPAKRVEVHTFHGFGTYIITRYQEYFPALQGFRPADDLAIHEALDDAFEALPFTSPLAKRAYGEWFYLRDARERISQFKQAGLSPEDVADKVSKDTAWCQRIGTRLTTAFQSAGRLSGKTRLALIENLNGILRTAGGPSELGSACTQSLEEAVAASIESGKTNTLSEWKRVWLSSEDGELYFKPADQLQKMTALAEIYAAYETTLQTKKLYDYDDMILFALKAIESNDELRSQLQESFQYIVADEYQDTNPAQARIIELIADNPVNEGRPNVMVVGDDDQAIYGFQGALGDALLYFRERWRDVQAITLTDNYRSSQAILDVARTLITQGTKRLENYYDDIDKRLRAVMKHILAQPAQTALQQPEEVAAALGELIGQLGNTGEVAVIASKHKYLEEVAAHLDQTNQPYFYEGREDLLADKTISNLLLLADACLAVQEKHEAHLDYVLPELLTTGLLPIDRPAAWMIAIQAHENQASWWRTMEQSDQKQVQTISQLLKHRAKEMDPDDALKALTFLQESFSAGSEDKLLGQKLASLAGHGAAYYQQEAVSLRALIEYVKRCKEAGIKLDTKLSLGQKAARIHLMSAHKSKGLEFDSVYVLHADEHTWFFEKGRRNNISLPSSWQFIEPATETFDDRLRLLYVVLSRAKQRLHLISSLQDRRGKPTSPLPGLNTLHEATVQTVLRVDMQAPEAETSWQAWYVPGNILERRQLGDLLKRRLQTYRLSPTHLTRFLDIPRDGPNRFLAHILLNIPEQVAPEAQFGSYVHAALRYMQTRLNEGGALPSGSELSGYVADLTDNDEKLTAHIVNTVTTFQNKTKSIQKSDIPEYNFSSQDLMVGTSRITGAADRFRLIKDGLEITDYKTGKALKSWHSGDDYTKAKLHRFRQQLLFYELLAEQSTALNVSRITSHLEFVEPTKREAYYRLTLDAGQEEKESLRLLISAVWTHIQELNIPDTTGYIPMFSGITQFEEDLIRGDV